MTVSERQHYAMFSGGHDSLVSTHYCMENGHTDAVLHLDTNTGIPANQEFVEDVCDEFGWQLRIESAKMTLQEFAKRWGFPASASHGWAYRYFKAHTLQRVAGDLDCKPHFWTGVRRHESKRRMKTVTDKVQEDATGRWVWHAPLMDWTEQDCEAYIDECKLPRNPVVAYIHRSGECYCGAFAHRDEELIDLEANYPDHYEWLIDVEQDVQDEIGTKQGYCFWGHSEMSSKELRALLAEHDDAQMVLCSDCDPATESSHDSL